MKYKVKNIKCQGCVNIIEELLSTKFAKNEFTLNIEGELEITKLTTKEEIRELLKDSKFIVE